MNNLRITIPQIVAVVAAVVLAAGAYYWRDVASVAETISLPGIEEAPAWPDAYYAVWKDYVNEEFGFSLQYPEGWDIQELDRSRGEAGAIDKIVRVTDGRSSVVIWINNREGGGGGLERSTNLLSLRLRDGRQVWRTKLPEDSLVGRQRASFTFIVVAGPRVVEDFSKAFDVTYKSPMFKKDGLSSGISYDLGAESTRDNYDASAVVTMDAIVRTLAFE